MLPQDIVESADTPITQAAAARDMGEEAESRVALVYGSFHQGNCIKDIQTIHAAFPKILGLTGLEVQDPVEGAKFNFNQNQ